MGHYASEMQSDKERKERYDRSERARIATTNHLQKMIDEKGIAAVLAEMILDPTLFSIHNRKYE